jgi:hypothetical protein
MVNPMPSKLVAMSLPVALSLGLMTSAAWAEPPAQSAAERLAAHQQRVALELEAEDLLVKLHNKPLSAELEPCINGGVSPSGRFASAEIEYVVERLAAGDLTEHLAESAYFRAFNDGKIELYD